MNDKLEPWHWPHPARWSDLTGEDPHGVHTICPRCDGAGCRYCRDTGVVTIERAKEAQE